MILFKYFFHCCLLKESSSKDTLVAVNTPSTVTLVSKEHSPLKGNSLEKWLTSLEQENSR